MIVGTVWLLVELVALFFGVAMLIHLFQRRLGPERLRAWMGGSPVVSALKGITVGFITPFCTYSAIPMLVGLRQADVPPAGYVAFISAAPVLDPVLFGALVLIVGIEAALIYTAVAFAAAITLAVVAQRVGIDRHLKPLPLTMTSTSSAAAAVSTATRSDGQAAGVPSDPMIPRLVTVRSVPPVDSVDGNASSFDGSALSVDGNAPSFDGSALSGVEGLESANQPGGGECGAAVAAEPWRGLRHEARPAVVAAFGLLRSVALLLMVGVAIGLLIEATVSPDTVAAIAGTNRSWSIPVAAALGTPLYFQTSLFVPIANSLTNAGVGIGAIVALTIAGAGANVPEFIILTKLASRRLIAIFFGYVFGVALVGGLIAQLLLG